MSSSGTAGNPYAAELAAAKKAVTCAARLCQVPHVLSSCGAALSSTAINCQVVEISRVLRPGGVFVGTTFLSSPRNNPFSVDALRPLRQIVGPINTSYNYFTEES